MRNNNIAEEGQHNKNQNTSRSRMDVVTPPPHPPPNPRRELKDECKSKLACAESREMAKTLQIPMPKATQTGKHRKKRCETQPAVCGIFC